MDKTLLGCLMKQENDRSVKFDYIVCYLCLENVVPMWKAVFYADKMLRNYKGYYSFILVINDVKTILNCSFVSRKVSENYENKKWLSL